MADDDFRNALRRAAAEAREAIPGLAAETGCDDEPIGLLVEALTRSVALMLGVDSVTAHRIALDVVADAYLSDADTD